MSDDQFGLWQQLRCSSRLQQDTECQNCESTTIQPDTSHTVHLPLLPPEIWRLIFLQFLRAKDLAHLWTSSRLVCWTFYDLIEAIFGTRWITEVQIVYVPGESGSSHVVASHPITMQLTPQDDARGDRRKLLRKVHFNFSRLDTSSGRAIFTLESPEEVMHTILRALNRRFQISTRLPRRLWAILFRHEVNDASLLHATWTDGTRELALDWKTMFAMHLCEEHAYYDLLDNWVCDVDPFIPLNHLEGFLLTDSGCSTSTKVALLV